MNETQNQKHTESNMTESSSSKRQLKFIEWQQRLLPFMVRMVIGLTLFFFLASCLQLIYLHMTIKKAPSIDLSDSLSLITIDPNFEPHEKLNAAKLKALIQLETHSSQRHYHQANVLLMSRVWIRYLGFVTGMILALVGAAFILGKLQTSSSEMKTKTKLAELSIKTASPGLILAVLGTALMLTTILTHHRIETTDNAVYLRDIQSNRTTQTKTPPPLFRPANNDSAKKDK